jgi:hypothetical protein
VTPVKKELMVSSNHNFLVLHCIIIFIQTLAGCVEFFTMNRMVVFVFLLDTQNQRYTAKYRHSSISD